MITLEEKRALANKAARYWSKYLTQPPSGVEQVQDNMKDDSGNGPMLSFLVNGVQEAVKKSGVVTPEKIERFVEVLTDYILNGCPCTDYKGQPMRLPGIVDYEQGRLTLGCDYGPGGYLGDALREVFPTGDVGRLMPWKTWVYVDVTANEVICSEGYGGERKAVEG